MFGETFAKSAEVCVYYKSSFSFCSNGQLVCGFLHIVATKVCGNFCYSTFIHIHGSVIDWRMHGRMHWLNSYSKHFCLFVVCSIGLLAWGDCHWVTNPTQTKCHECKWCGGPVILASRFLTCILPDFSFQPVATGQRVSNWDPAVSNHDAMVTTSLRKSLMPFN